MKFNFVKIQNTHIPNTEPYWVIPLKPQYGIGKYGMNNLVLWHILHSRENYYLSGRLWHDNDTFSVLHFLTTHQNSFINACQDEFYMNESCCFTPRTDKIKVIEEKLIEVTDNDYSNKDDWKFDIKIAFEKVKKLDK